MADRGGRWRRGACLGLAVLALGASLFFAVAESFAWSVAMFIAGVVAYRMWWVGLGSRWNPGPAGAIDAGAMSVWQALRRLDVERSYTLVAEMQGIRGVLALFALLGPLVLVPIVCVLVAEGSFGAASIMVATFLALQLLGLRATWGFLGRALLGEATPTGRVGWGVSVALAVAGSGACGAILLMARDQGAAGDSVESGVVLVVLVISVIGLVIRRPHPGRTTSA